MEDKGYFALHADEDSYRLYDIQFWLYVNANPGVEEQAYLKEYPNMLTFGEGVSTERRIKNRNQRSLKKCIQSVFLEDLLLLGYFYYPSCAG